MRAEVQALYQQAGLSLTQDLATLKRAPRIAADPGAIAYLRRNVIFNGRIQVPVLTMHTIGDGNAPVSTAATPSIDHEHVQAKNKGAARV